MCQGTCLFWTGIMRFFSYVFVHQECQRGTLLTVLQFSEFSYWPVPSGLLRPVRKSRICKIVTIE
jgi:hypothetical protein